MDYVQTAQTFLEACIEGTWSEMGRLVVTEFLTLDGVGQAPGRRDEDTDHGFSHGGWQAPLSESDDGSLIFDEAATMDALLLGSTTYRIFANYWPNAPAEIPFTKLLNEVPKYVASRTLSEDLSWSSARLLEGDIDQAVGELKTRVDELHVIGSLHLVQTLLAHGLVDELRLWIYPVVLGEGKRLFAEGTRPAMLTLTSSRVLESGTLHLIYDVGAAPLYRDMT